MFDQIEIIQAFTTGIILSAVASFILILWQRKTLKNIELDRLRLEALAVKGREILANAPDGLMLWDYANGGFTCSRRLAVLLNLSNGVQSRYDDIRQCFHGNSLKALEQEVSLLRANGTPFDILLTTGRRRIQAVGARAEIDSNNILADMVWMRDITATGDGAPGQRIPPVNSSGMKDRHLTALLDILPFPIWLRDSKLSLAFINYAAKNVAPVEQIMAESARNEGTAIKKSVHQGTSEDGSERWMEVTEIPLGIIGDGDTGTPGGTIGYAIDRTETEKLRDKLNQKDNTRKAVLEHLETAIAIFNNQAVLEFFNTAYSKLWSLDKAWLDNSPHYGEILERLRDQRKLPEVSNFQDFKNNQLEQFKTLKETKIDQMHLPDGRTVKKSIHLGNQGGLVFIFENVSDLLEVERSVKSLNAVQREALINLHEGIAVFGPDGRLKISNPVFANLWGINQNALNESFHINNFVDHMRNVKFIEGGWDDLSWGVHKEKVVSRLMSRKSITGTLGLVNAVVVNYANIPLPDGAMLLSYIDITDTSRVEQVLRERAEVYAEADQLKTKFISNVSYESRVPLTTIIGFAEMLNREYFGKLNRRQKEYAKGILETSNGLMDLLGNIYDLASIEAGNLKLKRKRIDIHSLLVSVLNTTNDFAIEKGINLEFDCPPDIGWISADEKLLRQATFNLISNAVTFTPERGTVRLESRREKDSLKIIVADTGIGITQDERERIFEPFEKNKKLGNGMGLGLSIVKSFIELHEGTVNIKSPPNRGTTITCIIPAKDDLDFSSPDRVN
ncbi:MAG: HAMP domain-containing sensor histidine kinase [Pseudomonadota bacterium]|nr:HAMP domain-containing sensor histidine kinase [Pseudomonadota bacterium]